ncbi:MAG: HDOD domain-containing protein [Algicola sp.]|nr:HDOD domain-containing protein [Algicola sp.]
MQVYTARQPILNAKKKVVAYELLFRDSKKNCFPAHVAPDAATAKLLVNSYLSMGLEAITEGKPAFINFPQQMLTDHLVHMVPYKNIVVEILETVEPTDENYELIRTLFHKRFNLALDDFIYDERWDRFMTFIKLIKIDIIQTPLHTIRPLITKLRQAKIKLLAEKIETYEEFEEAKALGFDYFQGYFLFTPEVMVATDVEASQHFLLSIYGEVMKDEFSYQTLETYFEQDMALTYKLMRFVNSSLFDIKHEITSLKQAMVFLGENQLRKFICLIVTAQINPNKPAALVQNTVIRARLCELLAKKMKLSECDSAFLTGLFSTIDAILDRPMQDILDTLPLAQPIKDALLNDEGELAECLRATVCYLNGDWDEVCEFAERHQIKPNYLINACNDAFKWLTTVQNTVTR